MLKIPEALESSIQERIESDTEFQDSLTSLSDDEKNEAIDKKKSEIIEEEFSSLSEKAKKLTDAEKLANNQKTRAEKAEGELKKLKPKDVDDAPKNDDIPQKDLIALMKADVHLDDYDRVVRYAKLEGISVSEALKTTVIRTVIAEEDEKRKTADTTNAGGGKRIVKPVSDDALIEKANKGDIPEKGSKEAEALFWARQKRKK